jgi:hypothetical protein
VNLQGENALSLQHKINMEDNGAAGEIAGESGREDGLAMLLSDVQRRDGMVVFLLGFRFPGGDGGQSFIGATFIGLGVAKAEILAKWSYASNCQRLGVSHA